MFSSFKPCLETHSDYPTGNYTLKLCPNATTPISCHEKLSKVKKQKEKNSKIRKRIFLNRTDNMTKKKIQKNDLLDLTLAENLCCRKENVQNKN